MREVKHEVQKNITSIKINQKSIEKIDRCGLYLDNKLEIYSNSTSPIALMYSIQLLELQ